MFKLYELIGSLKVHTGLVYKPFLPRGHLDSKEETLQEKFLGSAIMGEIFIGNRRKDKRRGEGWGGQSTLPDLLTSSHSPGNHSPYNPQQPCISEP